MEDDLTLDPVDQLLFADSDVASPYTDDVLAGDGTLDDPDPLTVGDPTVAASPSTSTPALITSVSGGLASIGNSLANIFRATNPTSPTAGYYNAAGQYVPIVSSTTPGYGITSLGTVGTSITSMISSLLPVIVIGGLLWVAVSIFSHHKK